MKTILTLTLVAALWLGAPLTAPVKAQEHAASPALKSFWGKFQSAVARNDQQAVAAMTKFPLGMPYGVRSIRTKAQLLSGYGKIFDAETRKCFAAARPQVEDAKGRKFSISCGEAMLYWFELTGGAYKFAAVDNVNE